MAADAVVLVSDEAVVVPSVFAAAALHGAPDFGIVSVRFGIASAAVEGTEVLVAVEVGIWFAVARLGEVAVSVLVDACAFVAG